MDIHNWAVTAAGNSATPPDGWPEGLTRLGDINDCAREMMAAVARWYQDNSGALVTGGSGAAYTLTPNRTVTAYHVGMQFGFRLHAATGVAPTLNVGGVAAMPLRWPDGTAVAAGELPQDAHVMVRYSGAYWLVMSALRAPLRPADVQPHDAVLDELAAITGWTRGDLVARGASILQRLPAGAEGYVLESGGAGQDLVWRNRGYRLDGIWIDVVTAEDSTTAVIPLDNTPPQIDEGAQFLSIAGVPIGNGDIVVVDVQAHLAASASGRLATVSIHDSSTPNSVGAGLIYAEPYPQVMSLRNAYVAVGTGVLTISARYGANTGTAYLNRAHSGSLYGSALESRMTVQVYKARPA